jgi:hypothetical protein
MEPNDLARVRQGIDSLWWFVWMKLSMPVTACAVQSAGQRAEGPIGSASATAWIAVSITALSSTHLRSSRKRPSRSRAAPPNIRTGTSARLAAHPCSAATVMRLRSTSAASDALNQLEPTYENWIIRREGWLPSFDLAPRYQRDCQGNGRTET